MEYEIRNRHRNGEHERSTIHYTAILTPENKVGYDDAKAGGEGDCIGNLYRKVGRRGCVDSIIRVY